MFAEILDIHFDPVDGALYWLELLRHKGLCRNDFSNMDDLALLGPMNIHALRNRPLLDFIPRALHNRLPDMFLAESGGTTGDPCRRVYLPDEFQRAFVDPWLDAVRRFHFPQGLSWLFVGPSGPHIIARAARAFARLTGSLEPFTIDCDVRWVRLQEPGSLGRILYMEHLMTQAMTIIENENIEILFTTPPLLLALAEEMSRKQCERIVGIHTGGMAQDLETTARIRSFFPNAVVLPGYGNSLFGVLFEQKQQDGVASGFFVHDPALVVRLLPLSVRADQENTLRQTVGAGERGRIMFHRFDRSFLLVNMLERDTAVRRLRPKGEYFVDIGALEQHMGNGAGVY